MTEDERPARPWTTVAVLLGLGLAVAGGVYALWWWEEVHVPRQWDGHRPFSCERGDFEFVDKEATGPIEASGTCVLRLVRPSIEASVRVTGRATVEVIGGRIHDPQAAVYTDGFARVVLRGTVVDGDPAVEATGSSTVESRGAVVHGPVRAASGASLVGFDEEPIDAGAALAAEPAPAATTASTPDRLACAGVALCFQRWTGTFDGKVTTKVDRAGRAQVTVTGSKDARVERCLTDLGASLVASLGDAGRALPEGELSCTYRGEAAAGAPLRLSARPAWRPAPR